VKPRSKPTSKPQTKTKAKTKSKAKSASGPKGNARSTPPIQAPESVPSPPDDRSVYQGFVADLLNAGRFELAEKYLDPVVVSHNPFPGQAPGVDGFVAALRAFRAAFPDLTVRATHYIAEGGKVVGRFEVQGTHQGEFMGLAPTGRAIHYEEIAIVRLAGGRIVEHWAVADALAILQQLGKSENG
jgi:predicted ester cyclase